MRDPRGSVVVDVELELDAFKSFLGIIQTQPNCPVDIRPTRPNEHGSGNGVFATRDIVRGEVVCYYTGAYIPFSALQEGSQRSHALAVAFTLNSPSMVVDGRTFALLSPEDKQNFACGGGACINSNRISPGIADTADESNVKVTKHVAEYKSDDYAAARVIATKDIKTGSQLLWEYDFKVIDEDMCLYPVQGAKHVGQARVSRRVPLTRFSSTEKL